MADAEWQLYYWKGFVGRADFLRLIFEEAGVKYTDVTDGPTLIKDIIKREGTFYPHFAPPLIKKGDFTLSQTHVASRHLAEKFGLVPSNEEDKYHAEQVNLTCHDFIAEGRLVFHGINHTGPYLKQKEETQRYIDEFVSKEGRLERWLKYFEAVLVANNGGKGFVVGTTLTYADLSLFHILRATEFQFSDAWKNADYMPALKAFKERIAARPKIAAYLSSDRALAFAGDSMM